MALITAFFYLGVVLVIACIGVALGFRLLQWFRPGRDIEPLEESLYAAGLAFAAFGVASFLLENVGWLRQGTALALLAVAGLAAGTGWRRLYDLTALVSGFVKRIRHSRVASFLALAIIGCVVLDSLLSMAPLSGSDALVYHFTVPMLGLAKGSRPIFWLINSFWVGQGHALIGLGLAMGSDRISMGLILLGGLLTAAAVFVLTRHLTSGRWAGLATLVFLLTPMVYWQLATSGSPDIWMAFYAILAVMAAYRGVHLGQNQWLALGGLFAGAAAGIKLTGWAIPVGIVTYSLFASRSLYQSIACGLWSLPTGILPLVRNVWWTGDPFYPFLTRWLRPEHVNHYSFAALMAAEHAVGFDRSVSGLLTFPFLLSLNGDAYGIGHYWGSIVVALAPLLFLAFRRGGVVHAATFVWGIDLLLIDLTSQQARFLLPVFPLALALVFAGLAEASRRGWRVIQVASSGTLMLALLFGLGSETVYARDFLPVIVGLEKRDAFLERMAPDFSVASFVNRSLEGRDGETMVFFQHVYYLRVPFLIGDPDISWLVDPNRLTSPQALLELLRQQNVRWVVKAPDYPKPLGRLFQALEYQGRLRPRFSADASAYAHFRVSGKKVPVHAVILEVVSAS